LKLTPSLDTITVEPEKKSLFDFVQMLGKMWRNLAQAFNGQISFGDGTNVDNINGAWVNTTTPVAPNTDFTVNHNLNRLPVGYLVMAKDRAVDVYTGSIAATLTQITLRATVASAVIRLFVFLALLSLAPLCFAQTTNVSGTITDAGGQTWNNGTITFIFNPGTASPPFANAGSPYTPTPVITTLNGSGSFTSIPVPSNSSITPVGTKWNVQVCPQSTSPCALITGLFIFGASQDISASVIPPAISVSPIPGATAYTDAQVKATKVGTHYYNLTTGLDRVCSTVVADVCTVWSNAGSGGGTVTIASGTAALGTGAIASGACATVVTSAAVGTLTTDNILADFNADPTGIVGYVPSANGILTIVKYPTSGNVNFKVCNNTGSSITPGAITLNWRVVR
jgi:hypothetical protein